MTLSTRDQVRLAIGDTDVTDPLLYDDEVDNFIAARSVVTNGGTTVNIPAAAADCAGAIAAKFAREFNFAEDAQRFEVSQRVGHYQALERSLRKRAGASSARLAAGTADLP